LAELLVKDGGLAMKAAVAGIQGSAAVSSTTQGELVALQGVRYLPWKNAHADVAGAGDFALPS
jgi:hypothetical protein